MRTSSAFTRCSSEGAVAPAGETVVGVAAGVTGFTMTRGLAIASTRGQCTSLEVEGLYAPTCRGINPLPQLQAPTAPNTSKLIHSRTHIPHSLTPPTKKHGRKPVLGKFGL